MAWDQTRNDIIKRALRICGVVAQGETPSVEQFVEGNDALNGLLKHLSTEGILLYKVDTIIKSLNASSVILGTDSLDYTCIKNHTSASTNQPITGTNYLNYWRQTGAGGVVWGTGNAYTNIGQLTLSSDVIDILDIHIRDTNNVDYKVIMIPYSEYLDISEKEDTSTRPNVVWIHKLEAPILHFYPKPVAITDYKVVVHCQKLIDDLTTADANPDMLIRLYDMLVYRLAANLSDEYGIMIQTRDWIAAKADRLTMLAKNKNYEDVEENYIAPAYK